MLDNIIRYSIKNKLIIGILVLVLIVSGGYSLTQLPIDAVPDITDNQVMIITTSPKLAAQEVEQLVTFPVEQAMVTIPNIEDMRSFSRFGLSIVTIVFEEDVNLYWARQQVQERLSIATANIPDGVGEPELAPVTTGLGEIYQYVVHTKPGFEQKYNATELRSIQDWIIKRQLLGTPGVAEVSGFGGHVKQYQVQIDPERLSSANVSIDEIFSALQKNNQNTGGAYINKNPYSYFIRTEGLIKSLDEIKEIVIKLTPKGVPILIGDVSNVCFGHGVRYGAATRNGEGEVVTGIVMMLKGANSSKVIKNVKDKIEQIRQTLPEGVIIEPYLDRKKLVDSAIGTVMRNLAEGALIVLFVLILFLGNIRSGLVVASVIPLAMLFAIVMMNLFNVSGNLMSLGAIDFGLIVDGTVIIVEAVMHGIHRGKTSYGNVIRLNQQQMDEEVYQSSSKIRTSAAFGEIIILIVYLPLWALTGVEGKMFTPMAQTVSFAIIGAFILSLTYVPMMSALCISKKITKRRNFSDKMMEFFQRLYSPIIDVVLRRKQIVLVASFLLFGLSLIVLNKLGGEFIPQLDEGDFAVETRVPVGSSIEQSIEVSRKAQKIILSNYSEVKQVVSKIGSGEIPTDPMPIEAGDMMIVLKPKSQWENASSREELAEKMINSLSVIPNATFSFQQPIQMRFNELLTGAKQDVVIKIYGENLDTLALLSKKLGKQIASVEGVNDLYVEEITGLPQIQIQMKSDMISKYGLNISDINKFVRIGFAGQSAGMVYEGERRFNMVVRLTDQSRSDIEDVRNLLIKTPQGQQIPLRELAEISYKPGPVQIQRDNAKRRVIIAYNVRGRDVKSTVSEIKEIIAEKISMPPAYYVTYGGQFKNLQAASKRLSIVLPIALLLIFILLYFTFAKIKQALLIFTAIPLSAIGGIFALYLRDMPFSISAGVGFIALFGVSVLDGIVLISEFNQLESEGISDIYKRVKEGVKKRLRPVLMTSFLASFGFLPMAISTTAGAEVQRPLATVVIGGLISATILTLIVLPVLYVLFSKNMRIKTPKIAASFAMILFGIILLPNGTNAQRLISLDQALKEAVENNVSIKIANQNIEYQQIIKSGSFSLPRTDFTYSFGEINSPGIKDNSVSISQTIAFPTVYFKRMSLAKARILSAENSKKIEIALLKQKLKSVYWRYVYLKEKFNLYERNDSIYNQIFEISNKRYLAGETNYLEFLNAKTQSMQIRNKKEQLSSEIIIVKKELQSLISTNEDIDVLDTKLVMATISKNEVDLKNNANLKYLKSQASIFEKEVKLNKSSFLPNISFAYNNQSFKEFGNSTKRFSYASVGIVLPIFPGGNRSKIKASIKQKEISDSRIELEKRNLEMTLASMIVKYEKILNSINYYSNSALAQSKLLKEKTEIAFKSGEISYTQMLQNYTIANTVQAEYLDKLYELQIVVIAIETITNNI
ncbi:MAG: CusA/CzcA family heavy metal efflux RND transporter [Marinifilaceae bacterium]|jgi:cobalt-zinc-cadmium resistance protein CzcA|nr:CusA/CzcA family heavy metal efflux RND transporter [Marinifilaceae bacterium]